MKFEQFPTPKEDTRTEKEKYVPAPEDLDGAFDLTKAELLPADDDTTDGLLTEAETKDTELLALDVKNAENGVTQEEKEGIYEEINSERLGKPVPHDYSGGSAEMFAGMPKHLKERRKRELDALWRTLRERARNPIDQITATELREAMAAETDPDKKNILKAVAENLERQHRF